MISGQSTKADEQGAFSISESPICVNCGAPSEKIYTKYLEEVRLAECPKCGQIVDKYVEFDRVLVFIDLLLQYTAAYRHVFVNTVYKSYWRVIVVFTMFSAYDKWTEQKAAGNGDSKMVYELEWAFYKSLIESAVEIRRLLDDRLLPLGFRRSENAASRPLLPSVSLRVLRCTTASSSCSPSTPFLLLSHVQVQRILCPEIGDLTNVLVVLFASIAQRVAGGFVRSLMAA
ncbi:Protein ARV [Aphelenchoides fujianensis]|nr:Protein ARV [Aphelenchoides fujianensis]